MISIKWISKERYVLWVSDLLFVSQVDPAFGWLMKSLLLSVLVECCESISFYQHWLESMEQQTSELKNCCIGNRKSAAAAKVGLAATVQPKRVLLLSVCTVLILPSAPESMPRLLHTVGAHLKFWLNGMLWIVLVDLVFHWFHLLIQCLHYWPLK